MTDHIEPKSSANGTAQSLGRPARQRARFAWTDPVTCERLQVEFSGSRAFLGRLEAAGFERVDGWAQASARGHVVPRGFKERSAGGDAA